MNDYNVKISKLMSKVLRHRPELLKIDVDHEGWTDAQVLCERIAERYPGFAFAQMEQIVRDNNKQRFSFNEDKSLIRANQGHTIPVDVAMDILEPPLYLYHGTAETTVPVIMREGLKPMRRLFVHLSSDPETALKVGARHGTPAVLLVHAKELYDSGVEFRRSANGVWQVKHVPAEYLEQ